jgi:hypothetical protein
MIREGVGVRSSTPISSAAILDALKASLSVSAIKIRDTNADDDPDELAYDTFDYAKFSPNWCFYAEESRNSKFGGTSYRLVVEAIRGLDQPSKASAAERQQIDKAMESILADILRRDAADR